MHLSNLNDLLNTIKLNLFIKKNKKLWLETCFNLYEKKI